MKIAKNTCNATLAKRFRQSVRSKWERRSVFEQLEDRRLLVADWHNPILATDVNGDGFTSPIDALVNINKLNRGEGGLLLARSGEGESEPDFFHDVSNDGLLSPIDVLLVVNELNAEAEDSTLADRVAEGFSSFPIGSLPGALGQMVDLQASTIQADSRIVEFGFFATDHADGSIDGTSRDDTAYSQKAWARIKEHIAVSANQATTWIAEGLAASRPFSVYLVHADGDDAVAADQFAMERRTDGSYDIRWEQQASIWPGLQVGNGIFDDAHLIVSVGEPYSDNAPPIISSVSNRTIAAGATLDLVVGASDADLPDDQLTFSLIGSRPNSATIDPLTGEFSWATATNEPEGITSFTVRVTDSQGVFDDTTFNVQVSDCEFAGGADVSSFEFGGSDANRGAVEFSSCSGVIREGDSFVVGLRVDLEIPTSGSAIEIDYSSLSFDQTDEGFVRDAFEIAFVDADGNSLIRNFVSGRDAFFNISENLEPRFRDGIIVDGTKILVGLGGLPPGIHGSLILRMVNNDSDTRSAVSINRVQIVDSSVIAGLPEGNTRARSTLQATSLSNGELALQNEWQLYGGGLQDVPQTPAGLELPAISVSTSDSKFHTGARVLITGQTTARGNRSDGLPNQIESVSINKMPVQVLDSSARFSEQVTIRAGRNDFQIEALDLEGRIGSTTVSLWGVEPGAIAKDFSTYTDTTASHTGVYGRTTFVENSDLLLVDLATRNDGSFETSSPLLIGVKGISHPIVSVVGHDGLLPDGTPYFDYSNEIAGGRLSPGQMSAAPSIAFHNPERIQFDYELIFLSQVNQPPRIRSVPRIDAYVGDTYRYEIDAVDPDSDSLTYSLLAAPAGMIVNSTTGVISWQPDVIDLGETVVTLEVSDSRKGRTSQQYTISIGPQLPNRPPIITSSPATIAYVDQTQSAEEVAETIDLSMWTTIQYEFNSQPDANWVLSEDNSVAIQTVNADPSILLSDFEISNDRIEGTWLKSGFDDDLMGFVFGYEDEQHFYLFDWKQSTQGDPWGTAEVGMSVKRVDSDRPLTGPDLWATETADDAVELLFHNSIPYATGSEYRFSLDFTPEGFKIVISDGTDIVERIEISDSRFKEGRFGFYNSSQGNVEYRGFTRTQINAPNYFYNVNAIDPDSDALTFSLLRGPAEMRVNSENGLITWGPNSRQVGNHAVSVRVSDGNGGTAIQEFVVCVHPSVSNKAPLFISTPLQTTTVESRGIGTTAYTYNAVAIDPEDTAIEYAVVDGPEGFLIDSTTGQASWTINHGIIDVNSRTILRTQFNTPEWKQQIFTAGDPQSSNAVLNYGEEHGGQLSFSGFSKVDDSVLLSVNVLENEIYSPSVEGPIESIDYSMLMRRWFGNGQNIGLALVQDGSIYLGPSERSPSGTEAERREQPTLTARDFTLLDPDSPNLLGVGNHPDFSSTGSDIQVANFRQMAVANESGGLFPVMGYIFVDDFSVTFNSPVTVPVKLEARDAEGATDVQEYDLRISVGGTVSGSVFEDANNDGYRTQPPSLLVASARNIDIASFDTTTERYRDAFLDIPELTGALITGMEFGPEGNLYISDYNAGKVWSVNPASHTTEVLVQDDQLIGITGLTFGPDDALYFGNERTNKILRVDPNIPEDIVIVVDDPRLTTPRDIEFLGDDEFIVLDALRRNIHRYSMDGTELRTYNVNPSAFGNLMTLGPNGLVYIIGHNENNLRTLDLETGQLSDLVTTESAELDFPQDLAFGPNGNVYVVSSGDNAIVEFDPVTGEKLGQITSSDFSATAGQNRIVFSPPNVTPEQGTSGVEVFWDRNRNARLDADELTTVTDSTGAFSFQGLPPGEQWISMIDAGKPGSTITRVVQVETAFTTFHVDFAAGESSNTDNPESDNRPTRISSDPPLNATTESAYVYNVVATSSQPLVYSLPLAPDGMTIHSKLGIIAWRPTDSQAGLHSVVLQVAEPGSVAVNQRFEIDVDLRNVSPFATFPISATATVGQAFELPLTAQDDEPNSLQYALEGAPAGIAVQRRDINTPAGTLVTSEHFLVWTPNSEQVGEHDIQIEVSDERGGTYLHSLAMTVVTSSMNRAPTVTSTPRTNVVVGGTFVYRATATDEDLNPLSWSLTSGPADLEITNDGILSWTPTGAQIGEHEVVLRVDDGHGGTAEQTFTLDVASQLANAAPLIVSNPVLAASTEFGYAYHVRAEDADNDGVRYGLSVSPVGMTIDPVLGTIRWSPTEKQFGEHVVTVDATDVLGARGLQRFVINVRCGNVAPAIVSVPVTRAVADRPYLYTVRTSDVEGDEITFSLVEKPDGMTINPINGVLRWRATTADIGTHTVEVEARDAQGGVGRQVYEIAVVGSDEPIDPTNPNSATYGNRAPLFASSPLFNAATETLYQYATTVIDPDGDDVELSLADAPAGMQLDGEGVLRWTPAANQIGQFSVSIAAQDSGGAQSNQSFIIDVATNNPPIIRSTPVTSVSVGAVYRSAIQALDPENGRITYSLADAPEGMRIDTVGQVRWQTSNDDLGDHDITVVATDDRGQSDSQSYTLIVGADTQAPVVSLALIRNSTADSVPGAVDLNTTYRVRVRATDDIGVGSLHLLVDGVEVALDASGTAALSARELGQVSLIGYALDFAGNRGENSLSVEVVTPGSGNTPDQSDPNLPPNTEGTDPSDMSSPTVSITNPEVGTAVSNLVPIVGTVDDPEDRLWYYQVLYSRIDRVSLTNFDLDDPDWNVIATSTQEVNNGTLAELDTTMLAADGYAIALVGFDYNGHGNVSITTAFVEGSLQLGNFRLPFTDLSIPLAGIPIQIDRVYDTLDAADEGDFGFGWSLGTQDARILETSPEGQEFISGQTKVYLTTPEGRRVGFTYEETPIATGFFGDVVSSISFVPDPGVYESLQVDQQQVVRGGLSGAFNAASNALSGGPLINPSKYTLTTKDGLQYRYDQFSGLEKITDRNGNTATFTEDGIEHSSGQRVDFRRDYRNRITEIGLAATASEPALSMKYEYDLHGNLVSYTNQASQKTIYAYLSNPSHYLDTALDDRGLQILGVQYDSEGRYAGVLDAAGNLIDSRDYDADQNQAIIRDGRGNQTILIYDKRGNVLEEIDPAGNKTIRRYEDPSNPDSETTILDRDGNVTEQEFDARGNVLAIRELGNTASPLAEPVVTAFTYDDANNVTSITNARGFTTRFDYDDADNLTRVTNALGDSSEFQYDDEGRQVAFTDFNGNETRFEYDDACPCGSPSTVINADGTYQQFKYNRYGQVTEQSYHEADGTLVEISRTEYDQLGRPVVELSGIGEDEIRVEKFYDGNVLDWEIVVNPESLDSSGGLLESPATPVAERKSIITDYEYDPLDRLVREINAEGGVIEYRYDADGNRTLLQDPVGNKTTWVYNELGRVMEERDPFYNADFATIDEAIADVTNPSGADCDSNTPAEHVSLTCYSPEGNVNKQIDRNGRRIEFVYDSSSNLTEELWYNDSSELVRTHSFSYDIIGNLLNVQDPDTDLRYTYDALNRVTEVDNNANASLPDPRLVLKYKYDAQGNIIQVEDQAGVEVGSTYDSLNRLATRTWRDSDVQASGDSEVPHLNFEFDYFASGRESTIRRYRELDSEFLLVSETNRTYKTTGRSEAIEHTDGRRVMLGYEYFYDFAGLIEREFRNVSDTPSSSFDVSYSYDLTGQLTSADYGARHLPNESFAYDANGNRLRSTNGEVSQSYLVGIGNQILRDDIYRYEYDGDSNRVKQVNLETGETRIYTYDHRDRMTKIEFWSSDPATENNSVLNQIVEHRYDATGRRVSQSVDVDGGGPESPTITYYAYDGDHIWVETAAELVEHHLYGDRIDQILASTKGQEPHYTLTDLIGSVRGSLSIDGTFLQPTEYSAYGAPVFDSTWSEFAFAAREYDNLSDQYFSRARIYDPSSGVFMGQDPLSFSAGDANLFRYVGNTPIHASDPFGEEVFYDYALTLTISTSLGAYYGFRCGKSDNVAYNVAFYGLVGLTGGLFISIFATSQFLLFGGSLEFVTVRGAVRGFSAGIFGTEIRCALLSDN